MTLEFNLVDDKWIKLIGHEPVSLLQFFDMQEAPKLAGTPVQKLLVFRLLLAIAQCACPLDDEDDYAELSVDDLKAGVRDYLKRQRDGFRLFDPERPFLQHPGVTVRDEKKKLPLSAFLPGACTGNATLLFDGNSLPSTLSDSDRVYALLSLVTFGMGGKKPDKQLVFSSGLVKKSAPASPALGRGWLHCIPMGSDVYQSLKLNLVTQDMFEQVELSFLSKGVGTPPWERMPLTEIGPDAADYAHSLVGWLVPVSRFCRLFDESVYLTSGVAYPAVSTGQCDLTVSTRNTGRDDKNTKITAVRARRDVVPWRQFDAVLAFCGDRQTEGCRALKLFRTVRQDDVTAIWCVGIQVSEQSGEQYMSGRDDFVESIFRIAPGWQDTVFFKRYCDEMAWIDSIGKAIYVCVTGYYKELSAAELGPNHAARAEDLFWSQCASVGVKMVEACGVADPKAYRPAFKQAALTAYDAVCPKRNARQLMAYQKCRPVFKRQDEVRK